MKYRLIKTEELEAIQRLSRIRKDTVIALGNALMERKHKWTVYERSLFEQSLRLSIEWDSKQIAHES